MSTTARAASSATSTAAGVVLETDAHTKRQLPASYVAEHVEHAYALTGHGMQGGTVEQAIVVASVGELTRGWSYTALSRAAGETRLLVRDATPAVGEREDIGPDAPAGPLEPDEVLARVARRMLERDDEDLAIDQLPAAGRADDPQLAQRPAPSARPAAGGGRAARRAARAACGAERRSRSSASGLSGCARSSRRCRRRSSRSVDELDARAIELTERRDTVRAALDRLPAPRQRRLGRGGDPHLVQRTELTSTLGGLEVQLERTLTERAALARQLGDIDAIKDERDGLASAIDDGATRTRPAARRPRRPRDRRPAAWVRDALGERPERPSR